MHNHYAALRASGISGMDYWNGKLEWTGTKSFCLHVIYSIAWIRLIGAKRRNMPALPFLLMYAFDVQCLTQFQILVSAM